MEFTPWQRTLRVVIYRKRVQHETRKNFQLDLFDPADGHYEYSAVVTNKALSGRYLWSFMCGRGGHEKAYGELKSGFAFASVPVAPVRRQQRLAAAQRARLQPHARLPGRRRPGASSARARGADRSSPSAASTRCATSCSTVPASSCIPMASPPWRSGPPPRSASASSRSTPPAARG